jgi:predicted ATPase
VLKGRRQVLHRRVAEALRAGVAASEPELLAHHFTQAGLAEAAMEWWGKAGQRSLERSALVEAIQQFTRSTAAFVSGAACPLVCMSGAMSATCSLICSRRSTGVAGKVSIKSRAHWRTRPKGTASL